MKTSTLLRMPTPLDRPDEGTFGSFKTDDGLLTLASMELPWIDANKDGIGDPQRSCITAGIYRVDWLDHPAHGWCYQVVNVIQRTGILLHSAGFAGNIDRGWQADLLGCISFGYRIGVAKNKFGAMQRALIRSTDGRRSKDAVNALNEWGAQESFMLQIIEAG